MRKKTLAEHVADIMREQDFLTISIADISQLGEAYERSGGTIGHPIDRNRAVIAAIRRSDLFSHDGVESAGVSDGRVMPVATFRLKDRPQPAETSPAV